MRKHQTKPDGGALYKLKVTLFENLLEGAVSACGTPTGIPWALSRGVVSLREENGDRKARREEATRQAEAVVGGVCLLAKSCWQRQK